MITSDHAHTYMTMIAVHLAIFSTSTLSCDQILYKEFRVINYKLVQFVFDISWDPILTQLLDDFITGRRL